MEEEKVVREVLWPPLHEGHNEPGPTDLIGEYRNPEQNTGEVPHVGLAGNFSGARIPGEVWPDEEPIDLASHSRVPPERTPEGDVRRHT